MNILLAPSYGNPRSRKRYERTILNEVNFEDDGHLSLLTTEQRAALNNIHPRGVAHFWGSRTSAQHDKVMARLGHGDLVLFMGDKKIKAAGEVGYMFRNRKFADELWRLGHDDESYVHVYSVANVRVLDRPRDDLFKICGYAENFDVPGQVFVRTNHVEAVLELLEMPTELADIDREKSVEQILLDRRGSRITPVEKTHERLIARTIPGRTTLTARVEAVLVEEYKKFRGESELNAFTTEHGLRADLYHEDGDEVEIIEAKSLAKHEKVRESAAQLLDYAAYSPRPATRLTALFPERPNSHGIMYLHRLGIDCEYLSTDGTFVREGAPEPYRLHMLPVWQRRP